MPSYQEVNNELVLKDGIQILPGEETTDVFIYRLWIAAGNQPEQIITPKPIRVELTPEQFRERFSSSELVNITQAMMANPALLDARLKIFDLGRVILNSDEVILQVNLLEQSRLIAVGRATQILQP